MTDTLKIKDINDKVFNLMNQKTESLDLNKKSVKKTNDGTLGKGKRKKHKSGGPAGVSIYAPKPYEFSEGEKDTLQTISALDLFDVYNSLIEYEQGGDAKLAINLPKPLENIAEMDTMSAYTHIQNLLDSGDLKIYEADNIIAPGYGPIAGMHSPGEGDQWHTSGQDTLYVSKTMPERMKENVGSITKPEIIMHELGHAQKSVDHKPLAHQKEGGRWHTMIKSLFELMKDTDDK